jgi:hypothetical protein
MIRATTLSLSLLAFLSSAMSGTPQTWRAGANGSTGQSGIASNTYTPLAIRTDYNVQGVHGLDTGGEFNNTTFIWTPQPGPVEWTCSAWATGDFGGVGSTWLVISMFKNGVDTQASNGGALVGLFAGSGTVATTGYDVAQAGDTYQVKIFMTTKDGLPNGSLNNDPRHVWCNGRSWGQ